ncbi:amino acid ABC transporter permease [Rhizobium sp. ARZ01]|uniref:amino acid ABC transporter permease n=1 Tax=Rhizobium sp. ARZ01 TaxID=2769313 RepID=UPI00177EA56B|nr:amino acid ABC transporter permease [Rhizobium sp. ARZ01]MBD9375606.1 amino acid ABC transporter permease [Rhizobium sp. ARZ01]
MNVLFEQAGNWLPHLWNGLKLSLGVTAASLLIGLPFGFLLSLGVIARSKAIRHGALAVVEIGRGAPSLVLLQFAYFGLPSTGLVLSSFAASVLALSWSTAAYSSEIIRAGLQSVPAGQSEAALAIGMTRLDTMRFVVLPQGLRVAIPALLGFAILIFQTTSLCFSIALPELTSRAYEIGTNTFQYLPALTLAGLLYLAVCVPATIIVSWVEARAAS